MLKKMKQLLLVFTLVLTFCILTPGDPVCAYTGHTQQEAVNWACARGNESWWRDVDGVHGCQCVDLILAYYDYLVGWHTSGNAKDYAWNTLPSGWTRVYSNPQPGDIVVWGSGAQMGWYPLATSYANNPYGHIGIVWQVNPSGSISTIETNVLNKQHAQYCERYPYNASCFIRPDFPSGSTSSYGLNIGDDFTAIISKADIQKPLHVRNDRVVLSSTVRGEASEHWYFDRQSDGTYVISSLVDGRVLDVAGAATANGTPIQVYTRWGGNENTAQKWYILKHEDGNYRLVPQLATDKSLDVYNNSSADGTVVNIWSRNASTAQSFTIRKLTVKGPSSLSIQGSSNITLMTGDTKRLAANTGNATQWKTVTWSSENSAIATVSSTGIVTGKKPGKVRIYARSNYNPNLSAYITVNVIQKHTHTLSSKTVPASTQANGYIQHTCTYPSCNHETTSVIYRPASINLSATSYIYSGKARKPSVRITDSNNKTISSKNYKVTYSKGRKKVGTYNVTITFKGNYSGTITKTFTISPPKASIKKLSKSKKAFTVQWSRQKQVNGYQILYATNKGFSNAKIKTVSKAKTTSLKIRTGKSKKLYYVKIRTYKNANGITYYSGWSKAKKIKTK